MLAVQVAAHGFITVNDNRTHSTAFIAPNFQSPWTDGNRDVPRRVGWDLSAMGTRCDSSTTVTSPTRNRTQACLGILE
ncbi:hypothetical protein M427DRAFT_322103 [Gonapodya prolifera JEL478]|uniref:Uncharacterized protein n=1 Tax=Gonapodya prolifera (strain JEL478) TaxID=1344416 RepID=A0A139AFP4_GONPJ|nr:hypothetical protein M427DRAFT_322103 [Gonapodya prolifera JEL478]|eukprot:KXS15519.1 hypothetical protein M427DRAFT_322103 [Gonapodya prolifera JEL478]